MTVVQEKPSPSTGDPGFCVGNTEKAVGRGIPDVTLLTGGGDRPYAVGISEALTSASISLDFIGSNELDVPELRANPRLRFLNLRGNQCSNATLMRKMLRLTIYYLRLLHYAAIAAPPIFHILWNNKFELFDRTALMVYYKLLGKRIVLTAHNVNVCKRDGNDSFLNRQTLKIQYALSDHIFVHTAAMKQELKTDFMVRENKISVIPFGINNTIPDTAMAPMVAKNRLGIKRGEKTLLFYGNIAPYKGLEYLISALAQLNQEGPGYRLIIAGRVKQFITAGKLRTNCDQYWNDIQADITRGGLDSQIIKRIEFIPDEETELYFKAADVLVLPYTNIFQSGVLFLGYSFGLPVIATDVGSLKEEIVEGKTGFVCRPKDSTALARTIQSFFACDLFTNSENRRREIQEYANDRYSWTKVAAITTDVYSRLLSRDTRAPATATCDSGRPF